MATIERHSVVPTEEARLLRRLRSRQVIDALDEVRTLRRLSREGYPQAALARTLGTTQPAVSQRLARAEQVADPPAGFSGASPYEIAQRYAAGEIARGELVDQLGRWSYTPPGHDDGSEYDWMTYVPGDWAEVERALDDGLLDEETYRAVMDRAEQSPTQ